MLQIFTDQPWRRRQWLLLFALAFVLRTWVAVKAVGFGHADEHFQVLEPAYGLLHGEWVALWEWERGLRSWILPGLVAGVLWALEHLGLETSVSQAAGLRIFLGALSLVTVGTYALLGRRFGGERAAKFLALFAAFWPPFLYYATRHQAETLSTHFVLLGAVALWAWGGDRPWKAAAGGLCLGIAFCFRFQMGVFAMAFAVALLWERRWKSLGAYLAGGLVMVLVQGLVDLWTWGNFLHAPWQYFLFNLWEGGASKEFGVAPWHRYLTGITRFFTLPLGVLLLGWLGASLKNGRTLLPLWIPIALYWGIHQAIGHKEDRFLLPLYPFLLIAGSVTFFGFWESWKIRTRRFWGALAGVVLIFATGYRAVHFGWDWYGDAIRSYQALNQRPDVTGVALLGRGFLVGRFYFRKAVPLKGFQDPHALDLGKVPRPFNYLLANPQIPETLRVIEGFHCQRVLEVEQPFYRCD